MIYKPHYILCKNGWQWHSYNTDPVMELYDNTEDYSIYTNTFLGMSYTTEISAVVSEYKNHLETDGHYGVLWLDVIRYECNPPHCAHRLKDMLCAIDVAEEHLLKIGMPFSPYYEFQRDNYNRTRKNKKLRELYDLDKLEAEETE